ncbi:MAG: hypothetical protein GF344_18195 [Chitinivibrionales bacterium]|nr:hypothetical protein [Chitinivibrionales bacterium]MBD3358589.1 hypothetical protein [Chitinivibrionales bacterium]
MASTNCLSCAMPLTPDTRGASESHCRYCTDEQGNLKDCEQVRFGIAQWFKQWQPGLDDETASRRAKLYMQAMPAWAE